jgi:hypothetical protein
MEMQTVPITAVTGCMLASQLVLPGWTPAALGHHVPGREGNSIRDCRGLHYTDTLRGVLGMQGRAWKRGSLPLRMPNLCSLRAGEVSMCFAPSF